MCCQTAVRAICHVTTKYCLYFALQTLMDEMNDKSQQIVEKISNLRQFEEMDDNSQQTEVMANNSWHNDEMASKSQQIGGNVKTSYCPNADNLLLSGSNGGIGMVWELYAIGSI